MSVGEAAPGILALGGTDEGDEISKTAEDGLGDGSGLEAVEQLVGALLDCFTLTLVGDPSDSSDDVVGQGLRGGIGDLSYVETSDRGGTGAGWAGGGGGRATRSY